MSVEGRVAATEWLGRAIAAQLPAGRGLDSGIRTAMFCASDKSGDVRRSGDALISQMLLVRPCSAIISRCFRNVKGFIKCLRGHTTIIAIRSDLKGFMLL